VAATAAGAGQLCALSAAGGITCSGDNVWGQLGDGNRTTQPRPPLAIPELTGVTSIAAGARHSCAIRDDGTAWCWGRNEFGQLGDGTLFDRSRPTRVEGIEDAIAVTAGTDYSCAIVGGTARTAVCWGRNEVGQLGARAGNFQAVPALVMDGDLELSGITQLVAGGAHTCALIRGGVKCWGANNFSETGSPSEATLSVRSPTLVALDTMGTPLADAVEIALGFSHTCALLAGGTVSCWGGNTGGGQLGTDEMIRDRSTPKAVTGLINVQHIASHGDFTCAVTRDGSATCWGRGVEGQMGDGDRDNRTSPGPPISAISGATKVMTAVGHACVVTTMGLTCWGGNSAGQIGNDDYDDALTPVPVSLVGTVTELAGGDQHTCAVLDGGTVSCWGDDHVGQLGDGAFDKRSRVAPLLPCP
jgi:alpha-tubulin suppressor-like RCC1 family protein